MTQVTWATTEDVFTNTGVDIDDAQLMIASGTIDLFAARSYEVDGTRIGVRDLYWLKLALCYQAAWLTQQPDALFRMEIEALGQVRSRTQFAPGSMTLGPFARKALRRVSWLKSRSLHVQSPFQDGTGGVLGIDPLSSAVDGMYDWSPIEGG